MKTITIATIALFLSITACQTSKTQLHSTDETGTATNSFITNSRQITFEGKRSGEGYFDRLGKQMIFQSERDPKNPFYQIFLKNLENGQTKLISTGSGKTTCGWIHPYKNLVLFSSTHHAKNTKAEQKKELDLRKTGKKRRYSWDYDKEFEIYVSSKSGHRKKNITNTIGYDAEASFSPNGKWIAFASNRSGYQEKMSPEDAQAFKRNASHMMDIYIMKSDGSDVKRLTTHKGYDGGPFFSPDGNRIVWRRFAKDGHTAEIYTMKIDGTDKRQLTNSKAMSWAPFYHPSGDYIIYTTSVHGHHNFELYAIDTLGLKTPVRVTTSPGFDGLPVFTPDGKSIVWSKKLANNQSQIFKGDWNDSRIRAALQLPKAIPQLSPSQYSPQILQTDIQRSIEYLASENLKGRQTGSPEEKKYTEAIAKLFNSMGLKPSGQNGSYFQKFNFTSKVELDPHNHLILKGKPDAVQMKLSKDWIPLAFSKTGAQSALPVVFAGYGIVAPGTANIKPYNSYKNTDVKDKWVLIFRYLPEEIASAEKQHLQVYSGLHAKLMAAQVRGAKGVIFVSGPNSSVKSQLIKFGTHSSGAASHTSAISITDKVAQSWLGNQHSLKELQSRLDTGEVVESFQLQGIILAAHISISHKMATGRNVLATLKVPGAKKTIIIGAHGDHLGTGDRNGSLKKSSDTSSIHFGADDNASGVAGVIELAHYYANKVKKSPNSLKQNILFAVWSGEEIGILGSNHFRKNETFSNKKRKYPLSNKYSAYLNMDMIGRMKDSVSVQGLGSSKSWAKFVEKVSLSNSTPMITSADPYLPTDAMALYMGKLPVLSFFTGVHKDYHSPSDTADKINLEGTVKVITLVKNFADQLLKSKKSLPYNQVDQTQNSSSKSRNFRVSLGTIPDYSQDKTRGVLLSGVVKGGAAAKAGVVAGDIIVKISNYKIANLYDFVAALQSLKPNKKTTMIVLRSGAETELSIRPQSKE